MINGKPGRLAFIIEMNFVIGCLQQGEYRLRFFANSMFKLLELTMIDAQVRLDLYF